MNMVRTPKKPVEGLRYNKITVSGKIATGNTTLAKSLEELLGFKYINAGALQRQWDREHGINENERGAMLRPDEHEREMEDYAKKVLTEEKHVIYEAWLSGFVARKMDDVFRILVICSEEAIRVDRVMNRENVSVKKAKRYIKTRESENIEKWKKLYGNYDFWDPQYYQLVIDTYSSGPMETLGKALDALGYTNNS